MSKTWIVVAHRTGARIIESKGPTKDLVVVRDLDHPEGRLQAHEIDSDRPGDTIASSQSGPHPVSRHQDPTEHLADAFAKEIATVLEREREAGAFERLVLVAAPRFLGRLRAALTKPTATAVIASLDKSLPDADLQTIRKHLEGTQLV